MVITREPLAANQARFEFGVAHYPNLIVDVLDFELRDQGCAQAYSLLIKIESSVALDFEPMSRAYLKVLAHPIQIIWGWIAAYRLELNPGKATLTYQLEIESPLGRLKRCRQPRLYARQSPQAILCHLLNQHDIEFQWVADAGPIIPLVISERETDYDLFMRVLTRYGLSYSFEHSLSHVQLKLHSNHWSDRQARPLPYLKARSETIREPHIYFFEECAGLSAHAEPSSSIPADLSFEHIAKRQQLTLAQFGRPPSCPSIQDTLKYYAKDTEGDFIYFRAVSNVHDLKIGQLIKLDPPHLLNDLYRVINIHHWGYQASGFHDHAGLGSALDYHNELILWPAHINYAKPPECKTSAHYVTQLYRARVVSQTDGAVDIDEHGHYRIQFAFLNEDAAQPRMCASQYWTGRKTGIYFPLRAGTDVMVAFREGDLCQGVILGALQDDSQPAPNGGLALTHRIRTHQDHVLEISDEPAHPGIEVLTAAHQSVSLKGGKTPEAQINASASPLEIHSHSAQFKCGQDCYHSSNKAVYTIGEHFSSKALQSISFSAKSIDMSCQSMTWQAEYIEFQVGDALSIQAQNNLSVLCLAGLNLNIQNLQLKAQFIKIHSQADVALQVGAHGLVMKADGTLVFNMPELVLEAPQIIIETPQVSLGRA